jgi:hypothetical protein
MGHRPTLDEAMKVFGGPEVAAAPIYGAADLDAVRVQAPAVALSGTAGRVEHVLYRASPPTGELR